MGVLWAKAVVALPFDWFCHSSEFFPFFSCQVHAGRDLVHMYSIMTESLEHLIFRLEEWVFEYAINTSYSPNEDHPPNTTFAIGVRSIFIPLMLENGRAESPEVAADLVRTHTCKQTQHFILHIRQFINYCILSIPISHTFTQGHHWNEHRPDTTQLRHLMSHPEEQVRGHMRGAFRVDLCSNAVFAKQGIFRLHFGCSSRAADALPYRGLVCVNLRSSEPHPVLWAQAEALASSRWHRAPNRKRVIRKSCCHPSQ